MKAYHIWIDEQIASEQLGEASISSKFIRAEIAKAKSEGAEKLVLHINSPGGQVFEGFGIYNELTRASLPIESYIEGMCASIATLIMLAGVDNTIFMSPASTLLFHKPMVGTQGNSDDHAKTIEDLKKIEDIMAERYAAKMGKQIEAGHDLMAHGDYILTPSEAKGLKIIDVIQMPVAAFGNLAKFKNDNKMKKPNLIAQLLGEISALVSPTFTAGMTRLADGNTTLYYEGDTLETGKAVFTDEAMTTKAPEGEHALEDGRIAIVDAAGVVVEIREIEAAASTELETANARIAELEAENTALKAEKEAATTAHAAQVAAFNQKFTALKAAITSGSAETKGEQGGKNEPVKESDFITKTKARIEAARRGELKK